jgi:hypothetical protein
MAAARLVQTSRVGAGIVLGDIGIEGGLQVGDRPQGAMADPSPGHRGKETPDSVEPGG